MLTLQNLRDLYAQFGRQSQAQDFHLDIGAIVSYVDRVLKEAAIARKPSVTFAVEYLLRPVSALNADQREEVLQAVVQHYTRVGVPTEIMSVQSGRYVQFSGWDK